MEGGMLTRGVKIERKVEAVKSMVGGFGGVCWAEAQLNFSTLTSSLQGLFEL